MILNLTKVILDEEPVLETEVSSELERIENGSGSFPVCSEGSVRLRITKDDKNQLSIHGQAVLKATVPCDRCLTDVNTVLDLDFYEKVQTGGGEPAASLSEAFDEDNEDGSAFEPDYYLRGYNLDVDKLLFGEALLNWPSRVLCREDCKGLCPVCGQNRNHGDCGCDRSALDPRMAKVLDVFGKFKEV